MSKSRKVLSALLAVVMVIGMLSVCAFAAGGTFYENAEDAAKYTQSWSLGTPDSNGGNSYTIKVYLSTDYPVGPVSFKLEGAVVTAVDEGDDYYKGKALTTETSDAGKVFLVPNTDGETIPAVSIDGHVATVTYTTSNANGAVTIAADPKNAENPGGSLVAARCTAGTVNASNFGVGQTASVSGQVITPPAQTATLSGTNGGFVDEANRYVYGVPAETANPATYFSTTGYIEMVANDKGVINGTGATLNLYTDSSKGTLVKSYTLVVFGDVDGSGVIDGDDFTPVMRHAAGQGTIDDAAILFAADVNASGIVDGDDATPIARHAAGQGSIAPNIWA